jgi:hypothetical protein
MLDILLFIGAGILIVLGILGAVLPGFPGAPFSYIGLLMIHFTEKIQYSTKLLVILFLLVVVVQVLDYVVPAWCTKKFGGSKWGIYGSLIGLVFGMFIPPYGFIIGPFAGALIGEMLSGRETNVALKAGFGSFVGLIASTGAKLAVGLVFAGYYIVAIFEAFSK